MRPPEGGPHYECRPGYWPLESAASTASLNVAIVTIRLLKSLAATLSKQQLPAKCKIRWWEPMVEDEINENTGDRDVEPDRHRPTPEAPMSIPAALKNRDKRDDDQRQRHKRE